MKAYLANVFADESKTTAAAPAPSSRAATVSPLVHVFLVDQATDKHLQAFKLEIPPPNIQDKQPDAIKTTLHTHNQKLWKMVKSAIPPRLLQHTTTYLRTKFNVSIKKKQPFQYVRTIKVFYTPSSPPATSSTTFDHIPDDVIVGTFAKLFDSCDAVCLAFTCTRYCNVLLTSSLVCVTALSEQLIYHKHTIKEGREGREGKEGTTDLTRPLLVAWSDLLLNFSAAENAALLGALSSFQHSTETSSMSSGFIKAMGLLQAIHYLTQRTSSKRGFDLTEFAHYVGIGTRGSFLLKNVYQGHCKEIVKQLQFANIGDTSSLQQWLASFQSNQHRFLIDTMNIGMTKRELNRSSMDISASSSTSKRWNTSNASQRLLGWCPKEEVTTVLPQILYDLCHDKTVECVDSTPLQHLATRLLKVCRANLNYLIHTIPLTIATETCYDLEQLKLVLLNRYRTTRQGINRLQDFSTHNWPEIDPKLSLLVFKGLHPGLIHRRTLKLVQACGLLSGRK